MLKQSIRSLYRHEIEKVFKEDGVDTVKAALDVIYGTYDNDYRSDFVIKHKFIKTPKQTILQRLNTLWVYPTFIVMMPFRYVVFGDAKVSEDSNFGKILIKLIGELR